MILLGAGNILYERDAVKDVGRNDLKIFKAFADGDCVLSWAFFNFNKPKDTKRLPEGKATRNGVMYGNLKVNHDLLPVFSIQMVARKKEFVGWCLFALS